MITLNHITKFYGKQKALDDISLDLREGEICGFLGPNGAGKSTSMKIITGCLNNYEGQVRICGIDARQHPLQTKKLIGYLPEHNPLYPEMFIREYLLHIARLYSISNPEEAVEQMIEMTGLAPDVRKKIGQLSKGYRQRIGLAQALIHDPQVLVLDEPMTGLDPNQLEEIRQLILRTAKNKTVLLSTHIMQEVEAICDRVVIINQGKIIADKNIHELRTLTNNGITITVQFAPGANTEWLQKSELFDTATLISPDNWQLTSAKDQRIELFNLAALNQCPIIALKTEEHNLEDIFRQLTNH